MPSPRAGVPPSLSRRVFLGAAAAGALVACSGQASGPGRPNPTGWIVTRWDTDEWSRGSYSALPAGTSWRVRRTLARAVIDGRVVLAGEYSATDHPATVHGAYRSGQRAGRLVHEEQQTVGRAIVVGAGIAGLAAASYLRNAGWEVEVVEARDRVGGRIHTDRSLGVPLERGASWVHGVTGNPMVRLVQQAGLSLQPTNFEDARARDATSGRPAGGVAAADAELWRAAAQVAQERPDAAESVATALGRVGWTPDTPQRQLAELTELVMEYGVDLDRLGAQALWEGRASRGGDSMVVGGYSAVPELLAADLPIRLSTPVRGITTDRSGATVQTDSGQMTADAVVLAIPLAVLQAGVVSLDWPTPIAAALAGLTTGNLEKVFLSYPEVWWPAAQVLQVMSAPDRRWSEWYPMDPLVDSAVIMGLSGGATALTRSGTDDEVASEAAGTLWAAYR